MSPSRAPSSHLFCLFRFRSRRLTDVDDNDRISTPEPHEKCRSQIRIAPFGSRSWSRAQWRAKKFFHLFRGYYCQRTNELRFWQCITPIDYIMSQPGRSPLYVLAFSAVALSSPRLLICQFLCILTPHSLGSAIGRPRRLVTHVPSLPPAKQHHARHAKGES